MLHTMLVGDIIADELYIVLIGMTDSFDILIFWLS